MPYEEYPIFQGSQHFLFLFRTIIHDCLLKTLSFYFISILASNNVDLINLMANLFISDPKLSWSSAL